MVSPTPEEGRWKKHCSLWRCSKLVPLGAQYCARIKRQIRWCDRLTESFQSLKAWSWTRVLELGRRQTQACQGESLFSKVTGFDSDKNNDRKIWRFLLETFPVQAGKEFLNIVELEEEESEAEIYLEKKVRGEIRLTRYVFQSFSRVPAIRTLSALISQIPLQYFEDMKFFEKDGLIGCTICSSLWNKRLNTISSWALVSCMSAVSGPD